MDNITLKARVQEISNLIQIRRTQKPDLFKKVITLETEDGQILFTEIRNSGLKILEREGVEIGSLVEVEISFQGTEKNGNKYNNIIVQSIKLSKATF